MKRRTIAGVVVGTVLGVGAVLFVAKANGQFDPAPLPLAALQATTSEEFFAAFEAAAPLDERLTCDVVTPARAGVGPGEPLLVTFRLTNTSGEAVWVDKMGTPGGPQNRRPWALALNGTPVPRRTDGVHIHFDFPRAKHFVRIEPGAFWEVTKNLNSWDESGYDLRQAGRLQIARSTPVVRTWQGDTLTEEDLDSIGHTPPMTRVLCPTRTVELGAGAN